MRKNKDNWCIATINVIGCYKIMKQDLRNETQNDATIQYVFNIKTKLHCTKEDVLSCDNEIWKQ